MRGYMPCRHFLCVCHGSSVESLLDLMHKVVGVGSVCYERAEANEYGVKEWIKEEIHVVLWLLTMKLDERHVDVFVVERSQATKDL